MNLSLTFFNFEQNNIYSFQCLISLAFSHLYLEIFCWSDPLPGSDASFLLRSVLANIVVLQLYMKWRGNNYNKSHSLRRRNAYNTMWFDLFLIEVLQTGSASTTEERNICRPICRYCSVLLHRTLIDYRDAWFPIVKQWFGENSI